MNEKEKELRQTIYRLMDSFLVESDTPRPIHRLNQDRHLFVDNMMEVFRTAVAETKKAYGGCEKCYGKGYATVRYGLRGAEDFGGDGWIDPIQTHIHYCECDRGKQLQALKGGKEAHGNS